MLTSLKEEISAYQYKSVGVGTQSIGPTFSAGAWREGERFGIRSASCLAEHFFAFRLISLSASHAVDRSKGMYIFVESYCGSSDRRCAITGLGIALVHENN